MSLIQRCISTREEILLCYTDAVVAHGEGAKAQVERILQSDTFRNAEALRRLLRYLADKSLSGQADQLKEYTVAVDALGKPRTYDPRQDSVVRIQLGRLRQKLFDYYRTEGKLDAIVVELPKGHFVLHARPTTPQVIEVDVAEQETIEAISPAKNRTIILALVASLVICLSWAIYSTLELRKARQTELSTPQWTSDMDALWQPFTNSKRPLLVSVSAPLFVGLEGAGLYRDRSVNTWGEALSSPNIAAIRKGLNSPQIVGRYYYTGFGEMGAIFQLGKLLAKKDLHISFAKSSDLSWQQLSDNNVILVGAPRVFADHLRNLPAQLELNLDEKGVRILHPEPAQPAFLSEKYPSSLDDDSSGRPGEIFALVTLQPGPLGDGYVASFSSYRSAGMLGAIRWFTEPMAARILITKLRKPSGEIPRYFQLLLKVKYKDAVPTEINYVMHCGLNSLNRSLGTR